jgi:hypothetical protein
MASITAGGTTVAAIAVAPAVAVVALPAAIIGGIWLLCRE